MRLTVYDVGFMVWDRGSRVRDSGFGGVGLSRLVPVFLVVIVVASTSNASV